MLKEATLIAGEEPTAEESSPFEQVGLVKLVNTHSSFVLIEARVFDLPPNLTLKSFEASAIPGPEAETAILKVSLERTGRFIVADIISGLPGKGDLVYR